MTQATREQLALWEKMQEMQEMPALAGSWCDNPVDYSGMLVTIANEMCYKFKFSATVPEITAWLLDEAKRAEHNQLNKK